MATLNFLVAIANFFIAGINFGLWTQKRDATLIAWMVVNFACGVFCLVVGVGAIVK